MINNKQNLNIKNGPFFKELLVNLSFLMCRVIYKFTEVNFDRT